MAFPRIDVGLTREERLPAILLLIFFAALCVAGGASREDVLAQAVIRAVAIIVILAQVLLGRLPAISRYRACVWLLGSMIALAAVQLVPLPPVIWTALPGRTLIASSPLGAAGWRPMSVVPDAGWNSLFSLLVPLSILVLLSSLEVRTVRRVQYVLMGTVMFSALLALLQAAGIAPDNPLINGSTTDYAGIFANRNHQALFLAIGIVATWLWGFQYGGGLRNRRPWLATAVVLLLLISILVTGSRSGAALGALAVIAGPLVARPKSAKRRERKIVAFAWPTISAAMIGGVLLLVMYFGRALSVDRAASLDLQNDFRVRSLPTVWQIARTYFPFGAGLGSFDPVFRQAEPFVLLEPTYFNHAHNDFLETVIETGIFGPVILLVALMWLVRQMISSSSRSRDGMRMGRLGGVAIGLVLVGGISDYAARTPMIMAVIVVAACWLTGETSAGPDARPEGALPADAKYL